MNLQFTAAVDGSSVLCQITSATPIHSPTLCFSMMAPVRVMDGGTLTHSLAGYAEVALPDLRPDRPHSLRLAHVDPHFRPYNRAWLPSGAYLRTGGQCIALPLLHQGVDPGQFAATPTNGFDGLRLVPQPTEWTPAGGSLPAAAFACDHPAFRRAGALAERLGLAPLLDAGAVRVTVTRDAGLPAEGYRLVLTPQGITLFFGDEDGAFWGAVTLLSLRETHDGHLPCGTITDAPRFGWRGQHLDCARHYFAPDTIRRLLDLMALFKLNRFHWHFADDEAFRLQVDCTPVLWQKTAFRGEGEAIPGVFGGGIRSGGSYSKTDATALIDHAARNGIAILPEIEVPAHAYAINAVLPDLTDPDDPRPETSIQGYPRNILNPAMPQSWNLLQALAVEVADLFPIGIVHLGGDELPPAAWDASPRASALKDREGLHSRDDLQGWTMSKLAGLLEERGIRSAAWEEAAKGAQGGIGHSALLFSWTGQKPGFDAARAGYDVVMCPAQNVYLDMAHTDATGDWGAAWAAFVGLKDTVAWSPVPDEAQDIAHRIVGVQGCFWSEFTTEDHQVEPMIAPRILGVASKAWDKTDRVDGPALQALALAYASVFDRIGWARNPWA